jgi:hypothetical protein
MKALVAGWFSFGNGHATAGDLMCKDLVCRWLIEAGWQARAATAHPFEGDVDWRTEDPAEYSHVVFVCGPFGKDENERQFLRRFWHCTLIGLNLSMKVPVESWNPFDLLIERNSTRAVNPDLVFGVERKLVPVIGVCLVEDYPEGQTDVAHNAIRRLVQARPAALVNIDTRLDVNSVGLRTPEEVESLLARMDVVVTTRLHAMVLSLRNGVPVVAIDPEGYAKIVKQAASIDWPAAFPVDNVSDSQLAEALQYCFSAEAREKAASCAAAAAATVSTIGLECLRVMKSSAIEQHRTARLAAHPDFPDWVDGTESSSAGKRRNRWIDELTRRLPRGVGKQR